MQLRVVASVALCLAASLIHLMGANKSDPARKFESTARGLEPPKAKRIPQRIITHGDVRVDPYFWMRERTNASVMQYLEAENKYAARVMEPLKPLQKRIYEDMLGHLKETDTSAPVRHGQWLYYTRTEKGKNYPIHCRKHVDQSSPEQVLLDVNVLAQGKDYFHVGQFVPSDDNNLLAFTTDVTGYRQYRLNIKDLRDGKMLSDTAERVVSLVWARDNKTLYYVTEDEVTKRAHSLHRHVLGEAGFERLYYEPDELFDISVQRTRDRKLILLTIESKLSTEVRFCEADGSRKELSLINPREDDHKYFATHRHGVLYLRTNDKAKNYRVAITSIETPSKIHWKEFIPHNPEIKIEDLDLFAEHAVISERFSGLERLKVIRLRDDESHLITLPDPTYELSVDSNPEFETDLLRFRYSSLVTPVTYYDYGMNSRDRRLVKQMEVPGYTQSNYTSERIFATASDGTRIPCSLVYRKGMQRNGSNPVHLYAYGSYGYPTAASFAYPRLTLLDRGVIYVIAHIRGGGELGEVWRDQGRMMQKRNTFTDFIDCAEHLVREKYTNPDRIAISGGSAGGLLVGAVVNMRPDLFRVAVAYVPFVDVLNTMLDATLPLTTSEYIEWGNPNEKAAYDYMKSYSPYDNIRKQKYPAMLVRVSLNDSQVPYWEGAKFVAKLRSMKRDHNLILLKTNLGAGHGGASARYQHLEDLAFDYTVVLTQLGLFE